MEEGRSSLITVLLSLSILPLVRYTLGRRDADRSCKRGRLTAFNLRKNGTVDTAAPFTCSRVVTDGILFQHDCALDACGNSNNFTETKVVEYGLTELRLADYELVDLVGERTEAHGGVG